jgi:hypothetical protein
MKPERIPVVRTAFVICFPMILAKKKVYNAAIIGFTVVKIKPTRKRRAPVRSKRISMARRIPGAYNRIPCGR